MDNFPFYKRRHLIFDIVNPLNRFVKTEAFSGIVLIIIAIMALVIANSDLSQVYFELFQKKLSFSMEGFTIDKPILLWINDGLMAVFFLLVGLEIKRETINGELSSFKKASLPAFAALGGMIIPALFYEIFNYNHDGWPGWGIPMATDIAFALGVLMLLGKRVPVALKLFLTALAIVDDLGAVIVIAVFYTSEIATGPMIWAIALFTVLMILNYFKVYRISIYLFIGALLWIALLKSGVHATIAGVLMAIAIPARAKEPVDECIRSNETILKKLKDEKTDPDDPGKMKKLVNAIFSIEDNCTHAVSPLLRLEHSLHGWVAYFIIPVFAFANAGIRFDPGLLSEITNPIAIGVMAGLILGKPAGITLFTWFAVKTNLATLPEDVSWKHIVGVGCLGGIGFTMSIFIDTLAFSDYQEYIEIAKMAILFSSLIAGIIGFTILYRLKPIK